jgi:hypothetical protein
MLNWAVTLAIGRIDIGHGRWRGPGPRAIVPGIGPELTGLGPASSRIEHRRRRLISEQLGGCPQMLQQAFVQGAQELGRRRDPVGQRRAVQLDALPGIDLGLRRAASDPRTYRR